MSTLIEVNHRLESRMREIRTSGSEGGGIELNRSSLPLSKSADPPIEAQDLPKNPRSASQSLKRSGQLAAGVRLDARKPKPCPAPA